MAKIIFLDIDGVLSTSKTIKALQNDNHHPEPWDPVACSFLKKICQQNNIKIVISSAWRIVYRDGLHINLDKYGLSKYLHEDKYTKDIPDGFRGHEIDDWLKRNGHEEYVILDDESDFLEDQMRFIVKTSFDDGITFQDMNKILTILDIRVK